MVDTNPKNKLSRTSKTRDPRAVQRFLEELSWVLASNSNLDFRAIADYPPRAAQALGRNVSKNPNIHFLVGSLPLIFENPKYFPSNEDIADFASEALELPISRWEKRSRYELIGLIVCETAKLDDFRLERLVSILARMLDDDPKVNMLLSERKTQKLSWNHIIQRLSGIDGEQD